MPRTDDLERRPPAPRNAEFSLSRELRVGHSRVVGAGTEELRRLPHCESEQPVLADTKK